MEKNKGITAYIDSLYSMFSDYGVSKKEFYYLVRNVVEQVDDDNVSLYKKKLNEMIVALIAPVIENNFTDSQKAIQIINTFISNKFIDNNTYDDSCKNINLLSNYLNKFNLTIDPDVKVTLFNNDKLYGAIDNIFSKNRRSIVNGKGEIIFQNELLNSLIEIYCEKNDIKIEDNSNFDESLMTFSDDSLTTYLKDLKNVPLLDKEQEEELLIKIKNGDVNARKYFISCNLRLVISVAKKFYDKGLDLSDLVQEGNIGLMKAVDRFDLSRGNRFSTYAIWWIRQTILRAIADKGRNIRIPVHINEKLYSMYKATYELDTELGRTPTEKEIAERMKTSVDEVRNLLKLRNDTISLSTRISDEDDSELQDLIAYSDESPEDEYIENHKRDELFKALDKVELTDRQKDVILLRYGLSNGKPMTLKAIGEIYGVSRERIRQVHDKALLRIQKYFYRNKLASAFGYQTNEKNSNNNHLYQKERKIKRN